MPDEPTDIAPDRARRAIAGAAARLARQRDLVAEAVVQRQYASVLIEARVLRTMEATLARMRDRLRIAEQPR
jgi:hypothetical protein